MVEYDIQNVVTAARLWQPLLLSAIQTRVSVVKKQHCHIWQTTNMLRHEGII